MKFQLFLISLSINLLYTPFAAAQPFKIASDTAHGTSNTPVEMGSITILAPRKDVGQIAHLSGSEILLREQELKRFDQVDGNQIL